ncbi:MAG: hypothetical protein H7841_02145 [Magnetospirillum sp. WYHS-4]
MAIQFTNQVPTDLAEHFMECGKLGRYLTVYDESRFVITDDFGERHQVLPAAAAMATICSKDLLVAQAALMPLARRADRSSSRDKGRFEELFHLIEQQAFSTEVRESAHLMVESGFRMARIKAIEAELGGKITPARKRYLTFLVIVRQLTEGKVSAGAFRDEFMDFTYAVAGKLDFGIYSFCLDRIFGNVRIPLSAKQMLVDEIFKYPPLIRRELLTNILVTNAQQNELGDHVRACIRRDLDENVAMEVYLLEQLKLSRLSVNQIEDMLARPASAAVAASASF